MASSLLPWHRVPKRYRLVNAQIVDTKDAKVYQNCSIDIADGVIRRLSRHAEATPVNNDALQWSQSEDITLIDLEGKFVMPGLIDCHVHLAMPPGEDGLRGTLSQDASTSLLRQPWLAKQMLDRGFTSIRDCGGAGLALKTAFEQGLYPGPRLYISGHAISQTGGHGDTRTSMDQAYACCGGNVNNIGRIADGPDQCMYAAREELRQGADFLKIIVSGGVISPTDRLNNLQYTPAEIRSFTKVAADAGTYVTAHAYTPAAIRNAVENGVQGIEHGNLLDKETAELMAEKGVFLTPTLVTYNAMASKEFAGFLPPSIAAKNLEILQAGLQSVQLASEAGVVMVFGTDLVGPMQIKQSDEFLLRKQAGQNAAQILQAATINGAKLLQQEDKLGRIKEGYFADLLILNASPLDNVELLSRPEKHILVVMKAGKVMTSRWSKLRADADDASMLVDTTSRAPIPRIQLSAATSDPMGSITFN